MDAGQVAADVGRIVPDLVLVGTGIVVLLLGLFRAISFGSVTAVAAMGFLASLTLAVSHWFELSRIGEMAVFGGSFADDRFTGFFRILFLAIGLITVAYSYPVLSRWTSGRIEFLVILISCIYAMTVMAASRTLLMVFLSLEFVSVTSYILTGMQRHNREGSEAALKYILYGSAAGGVMLYGMTFLYGMTGEIGLPQIGAAMQKMASNPHQPLPPTFGLLITILISGGFAYKVAAVPFHMWCPDAYQGAPTPVTAFFSIGPKIAGFAMFMRFLEAIYVPSGGPNYLMGPYWWNEVVAALALLTMAVGNLGAISQSNLKRLFAYSGIAHAGYMLIPLHVCGPDQIATVLFYGVAYLFMNLGAFLVILIIEEKYGIETVEDCRGLGWVAPGISSMMVIFLLSLVGVPPLAGFVGKLWMFGYVLERGEQLGYVLVVAGVLFSVMSLYYYMRIAGNMFLVKTDRELRARHSSPLLVSLAGLMAAATLALGLGFSVDRLMMVSRESARSLAVEAPATGQ